MATNQNVAYNIFENIFGWIGLLTSIAFFINPFFTIYNLYKGTQEIQKLSSGIDLFSIYISALLWVFSDSVSQDFSMLDRFTQNNWIGANLTFIEIILYLYFYTLKPKQSEMEEVSNNKIKINVFKYLFFFISLCDITFELGYLSRKIFLSKKDGYRLTLKGVASGLNLLIYTSSWLKIIDVIKEKKAELFSLQGYILGAIRHFCWVGYGITQFIYYKNKNDSKLRLPSDFLFIIGANAVCLIMCLVLIFIYFFYVDRNSIDNNKIEKIEDVNIEDYDKEPQDDDEDKDEV